MSTRTPQPNPEPDEPECVESGTTNPEPLGLLGLAYIGCQIQNQHIDLVCRLADKGLCPRCLDDLSKCGWCYFTNTRWQEGKWVDGHRHPDAAEAPPAVADLVARVTQLEHAEAKRQAVLTALEAQLSSEPDPLKEHRDALREAHNASNLYPYRKGAV